MENFTVAGREALFVGDAVGARAVPGRADHQSTVMPEVGWPPWLPVNGHLPALLSSFFASMLLSRACSALFPAPIQGSWGKARAGRAVTERPGISEMTLCSVVADRPGVICGKLRADCNCIRSTAGVA